MSTYTIANYASMLTDSVRVGAYEAALRECITPGCTVLEIGTGTGFFAVLACRLGAGRVHAVELDEAIELARQVAEANGVADRITFHPEMSTRIELDEPADVLFSDLRGVLPLFQRHVETIVDARERLLRPGGRQIPLRDRIWLAPVRADQAWRERVQPWSGNDRGIDHTPVQLRLSSAWSKVRFEPGELAAPAALWVELDYTTCTDPSVRGRLQWTLAEPGWLHGVAAWFDSDLTDTVEMLNAPHAAPALYGHGFFPFPEPLLAEAGDVLTVDLRAHMAGDDDIWEWRTRHGDTRWRQSTLSGAVLSPERFRRGARGARPALGQDGRIDAFVMTAMDGSATVGEIAERPHASFPDAIRTPQKAPARVSARARTYGE